MKKASDSILAEFLRPKSPQRKRDARTTMVSIERRKFLENCAEYAVFDLRQEMGPVRIAFSRVVRRYRKQRGLSQEEFAAIVGMDRTYPSLLERARRTPTIGLMVQMAVACKVTPVEFWCEFLNELREVPQAQKARELRDALRRAESEAEKALALN